MVANSALLVIDMQNSFCHEDGALFRPYGSPIPDLDGIIDRCAHLVRWCRDKQIPVIFTRQIHQTGYEELGPTLSRHRERMLASGALLAGSWDADIIQELTPHAADHVVDKSQYDAFWRTTLDELLDRLEISELLICGVVTNACVETTTRSAAMRGYRATVFSDCCGSRTLRYHEMSLECMEAFGVALVRESSEVLALGGEPTKSPR